jgi:hypothetical protein
MALPKPELDDLRLAYKRVLHDRPDKVFAVHPHIHGWIQPDLDEWLSRVSERLVAGYTPAAASPCPAPKPDFLIRPGSVLDLEDELVFAYVVTKLYPAVHLELSPAQGNPDIAHLLSKTPTDDAWIRSDWKVWSKWREDSLAALADAEFVLTTDIVGFYDNIELSILASDVKLICGNDEHVSLLMACLNRWSQPRGRGIPQGYSPSHILAKIYLRSLDAYLADSGYRHLRYVDDIRVFCASHLEAQKAIIDIGKFLSKRGLNLQGAKTKILDKESALIEFDGVSPIIEAIQKELKAELEDAVGSPSAYISEAELLKALEDTENPPVALLEKAFSDYLVENKFNKTLFHYLLTRLGKGGSTAAVDYSISTLRTGPEETGPILRYLAAVDLSDAQVQRVADYFLGEDCIYDYQKYQLMRWCSENELGYPALLSIAREWAFDGGLPQWVRSLAISVLGNNGASHYLEVIEARYDEQASELLKADCVFACRKQEKGRRNTFYSKAENDGYFIRLAIKAAKAAT